MGSIPEDVLERLIQNWESILFNVDATVAISEQGSIDLHTLLLEKRLQGTCLKPIKNRSNVKNILVRVKDPKSLTEIEKIWIRIGNCLKGRLDSDEKENLVVLEKHYQKFPEVFPSSENVFVNDLIEDSSLVEFGMNLINITHEFSKKRDLYGCPYKKVLKYLFTFLDDDTKHTILEIVDDLSKLKLCRDFLFPNIDESKTISSNFSEGKNIKPLSINLQNETSNNASFCKEVMFSYHCLPEKIEALYLEQFSKLSTEKKILFLGDALDLLNNFDTSFPIMNTLFADLVSLFKEGAHFKEILELLSKLDADIINKLKVEYPEFCPTLAKGIRGMLKMENEEGPNYSDIIFRVFEKLNLDIPEYSQ